MYSEFFGKVLHEKIINNSFALVSFYFDSFANFVPENHFSINFIIDLISIKIITLKFLSEEG